MSDNINKLQSNDLPLRVSPWVSLDSTKVWFILIASFMTIDLCQIQLIIRPLAMLRPGLIVTVMLACCVFGNWGQVKALWVNQLTYIICFICLLFVLSFVAQNNYLAFMTGRTMLLMLPLLLSLSTVVQKNDRIHAVFLVLEWNLLILTLYALSHGGRGPGGMMSDENDLTLFIVTILPITFYLYGRSQGIKGKIFHLCVMGCSLLAIVVAFSRGGFVGFVGMLFVYWFFSKKKIVMIVIVGVIFALLYVAGGDAYFKEMKTITDTEDSTSNERLLSWQAGWDMFLDNPLGVGGNNFQVRFPEYQPEEMSRNMWGRVAHSLWFTLIPETGILGIWLFLCLLLRNCRDIWVIMHVPEDNGCFGGNYGDVALGKAYMASMVGFFGAATFISVLYYTHFWYLSVLIGVTRASMAKFAS